MSKVGLIISSFLRDDTLYQSVKSLMQNKDWLDSIELIIVDQNPGHVKRTMYGVLGTYVPAPFDCGLSMARNIGVEKALELGCEYCVISADSICYASNFVQDLTSLTNANLLGYDLIGLPLSNRIGWEGEISLLEGKAFEINFIKKEFDEFVKIVPCSIVRNFFVAKTEILHKVLWDNNLKMREHEDFFYRCKLAEAKVGCTNIAQGDYIGVHDGNYLRHRSQNMQAGLGILKEKYKIKGWVTYKNLDNTK